MSDFEKLSIVCSAMHEEGIPCTECIMEKLCRELQKEPKDYDPVVLCKYTNVVDILTR